MPTRASKRKLEDPTKSDSNDEDYNEKVERTVKNTAKQRSSRGSKKRPPKKRRRRDDDDDDDDDDDESDLPASDEDSDEESFEEEEPAEKEEVEFDERTGRPKRSSTKKSVKYDVDDNSSEDEEEEEPTGKQAESKQKGKGQHPILKLKITPQPTSATSARTMRGGSMPRGKRGPSGEPLSAGTRRSARLHHDEQVPIVALSDSGHHEIPVRPETRSPEGRPRRSTRGGKGLKAPATSAIFEEEEEAASVRVDQPAEGPTSSPVRRQPSDTAAPEGMLSVEDSDPERVQEMQMTNPHELEEEHEAGEDTAQAKESEVKAHDEGDDEDDQPVSRGRPSSAKVPISKCL